MRFLKKILFFFSIFILYIIAKEFIGLYQFMYGIHPIVGYATLAVIVTFAVYTIILPVIQILRMPRNRSPVMDAKAIPELAEKRVRQFKNNPYLKECGIDVDSLPQGEEGYDQIIQTLKPEADAIRKRYVTQLFYSSSIAQNGFLDAILILSSSVNCVKDLFLLFHGRVSNRDLWIIAKKVYVSMAIGGSEGVEYATEEIFSKLTSGGVKSIPFASKILGSIADGFINAVLLNRIAIITQNYCTMLYLPSESELYPSYKSVVSSTKIITADILERIFNELKSIAKEKTGKVVLMTVNPVGYILGSVMGRMAEGSEKLSDHQKTVMLESAAIAQNPFGFGLRKFTEIFKRKREDEDFYFSPFE